VSMQKAPNMMQPNPGGVPSFQTWSVSFYINLATLMDRGGAHLAVVENAIHGLLEFEWSADIVREVFVAQNWAMDLDEDERRQMLRHNLVALWRELFSTAMNRQHPFVDDYGVPDFIETNILDLALPLRIAMGNDVRWASDWRVSLAVLAALNMAPGDLVGIVEEDPFKNEVSRVLGDAQGLYENLEAIATASVW